MKSLIVLFILLSIQSAHAQRVFQGVNSLEVAEWSGQSLSSLSDIIGEDAALLESTIKEAIENSKDDSFWLTEDDNNSCYDASNNLIDEIRDNDLLPEGSSINQLGKIFGIVGSSSDSNNKSVSASETLYSYHKMRELRLRENNSLDPLTYAHTLSIVELPNGNYYALDNWNSGGSSVMLVQVYPIDEDGTFFSSDPNETDINNYEYRIPKTDRGLCPDGVCDDPEDEPEDEPLVCTRTTFSISDTISVQILTSSDPNDKLGLRGAGTERFIRSGRLMEYLIRFENMPDASAPAQEVLIRDTLDTKSYDLSTFELGDITFGDETVEVPEGLQRFDTRVPVLNSQFDLLITAGLVPETGVVTWKFTTLDPETNDLPFDPLHGFLPPNQTSPEGEGSVSFNVRAFNDLPNDHDISNEARIIFDLNEPIDTPVWSNMIDNSAPLSSVVEFSSPPGQQAFTVAWSGSDGGSGIKSYDVYVSINNSEFISWQRGTIETEGRFVGDPDSTYSFFSVAHDAVGNSEPMKTEADASTTITVSTEDGITDLPVQFELFQNYPNPFNPSTTINFALPEQSDVTIRIYDVMGRRIATLLDENRPAGYHNIVWNGGNVASGTYFYRIQAGEFTSVKKLTLVK